MAGSYNAFRRLDKDTGGDVQVTASPNVFTNGRGQARVGDVDNDVPPDPLVTGSPTVFTNNKRTCRRIDIDSDLERATSYSPNVLMD